VATAIGTLALVVAGVLVLVGGGGDDGADDAADSDFRLVADDTDTLEVEAPVGWDDVQGAPVEEAPNLVVAPDVDRFEADGHGAAGLVLRAPPGDVTVAEAVATLGASYAADCTPASPRRFDNGAYRGSSLRFDCPGGSVVVVVAAGEEQAEPPLLALAIESLPDEDPGAVVRALATFGFRA
jgi:hypothetical protein